MLKTVMAFGVAVVLALAPSAWASIIESPEPSTADNYNAVISSTDLINNGQATLSSASISGALLGGAFAGTNDGVGQDGSTLNNTAFVCQPVVLEYALNTNPATGGSALGYSISQVDFIAGWWAGEDFANQNWSMAVATLANPTFATVTSVVYSPFQMVSGQEGFGYSHVTLTDGTGAIATGVTAVQFTVVGGAHSGLTVVSEIDVAGTATIPEPSTSAMIVAGVVGLLAYAWRRRK